MIELFFVACLQTAPTACEERSIVYFENVSLVGCLTQAQPQLAQWSVTNPGLTIARWSCRYTGEKDQEA